jgi:hypothetical protein
MRTETINQQDRELYLMLGNLESTTRSLGQSLQLALSRIDIVERTQRSTSLEVTNLKESQAKNATLLKVIAGTLASMLSAAALLIAKLAGLDK